MNPFWNRLYDRNKDRRYAILFLFTFLIFIGLAAPGIMLFLRAGTFNVPPNYLLPGIGGLLAVLVWRTTHHLRMQRREPDSFSRLSRDELHKARSKLLKDRNLKKS